MIYSMTGYGRAEHIVGDKTFLIEIKSLNGKQFDVRLTLPALLKPYEFDIRNKLNSGLERGSVECTISLKQNGTAKPVTINTDLLKAYYNALSDIATELNADKQNLLASLLKLPEVVINNTEILSEDQFASFLATLDNAISLVNDHRKLEGNALKKDLMERLTEIEVCQKAIIPLEPKRKERIREQLVKMLEEKVGKENYDTNRLEQELIYYIEKIDISEEQVRLNNHCNYFKEILNQPEKSKGKKLSFILQEFGREINTTGSKANDAEIQKLVVQMKDELEKMKEQILNVL